MQQEILGKQHQFEVTIFDKNPDSWTTIEKAILSLARTGLDFENEEPLLGEKDEDTAYTNLEEAFLSPDSTVAILQETGNNGVIGYTLAMPIGRMDPNRKSESDETAYIYHTVLLKEERGKGLVGRLSDALFMELARQEYLFAERDSMIDNGYADKIQKHYKGSIIESYDHEKWPDIGPERHFRIDIRSYLSKLVL